MKNKFQSKSVPRGTRTIWRYLSAFILFFALSIGQMWADATITLADVTPASNWYEVTGVGRVTNKKGNAFSDGDYNCTGTGYKTGSSYFTVQTYMAITGLQITATSTSNRTVNGIAIGDAGASSAPSSFPDGASATGSIKKETCDQVVTINFGTTVAANKYISIGLSGNSNIFSVTFIAATVTKHSVTYALNGAEGTTPTQADVAEGAKFTLHNGTTGITAPSGKQFAGWNDGSTTYLGGAEYTMGTANVTLTAQWETAKTDPTATFSNGAYVVGASALDLSGLWSSNSDGAVTYALKEASDDASVTAGAFSATKAGSYVVTASQAATSTYNAIEKEATITVTWPATGAADILFNIATGTGNTALGTASKEAHSASINTLSNFTAAGGLTVSGLGAGKDGLSTKLQTLSEKDASKYIYVTFNVADGYIFTINSVTTKVVAVSSPKTIEVALSDATTNESLNYNQTNNSSAATHVYEFAGKAYEGTVTLKIYAYGATDHYRLAAPLTISGTVDVKPSPAAPSISAPDADQAAVYDLNDVIAPLEITASGYPTPTYQWYKNSSASTEGATAISGAESASYTPANDVASDSYYYCVATNSQGSATSHYFHVTVNAPAVPTIYTETTALTLTSNKVATASETFTFSGANLGETAVTLVLASAVDGLTLSESSVTPTAGAIADTEVTVSYKSVVDVAEASVNLYLKQGDDILKTIVLTYSSTAGIESLASISAATTWDWNGAADAAYGTLGQNDMIVLANADVTWDAGFNALAIAGKLQHYYRDSKYAQGHELKFNTTIPGRVTVTFSNTGGKDIARAPRITDVNGSYAPTDEADGSKNTTAKTYTHNVAAGDVLIAGFEMQEGTPANMLRYYKVEFVPTYTVAYAAGEHGSGDMADANAYIAGEEVTLKANTFTPESGYVWSGWVVTKTASGDPVSVTDGKFNMPAEAVTVTAQWDDASKVAIIVDTNVKYESLAEAIAAATDGQTVQLIQDITQEEAILIDKNLTLDLNNKTFTVTNPSSEYSNRAIKVTAGTIVIENGTVDALSNETHNSGCWGSLRQEGGHLTCNNVTFKNYRSGGLGLKPVGGTLILNECTVLSEFGGGMELGNATVQVNNCTFTQTGTDAQKIYGACFGMGKMGTLTINGGTYTSDNYSFYIYTSGGTINVNSGTFAGDIKTEMNNTQYPSAVGTINISGGTFDGVGENPIVLTTVTANDHIAISGGVFDAQIEKQYCAEGYVPQDNGDGTYGVTPKEGVEIIGVVVTGNTTGTVSGLYQGTATVNLNSKKIDSGKYIYVTLKEGYTFEENDVLIVDVNAKSNIGTKALEITTGVGNIDGAVWKTIASEDYATGDNIISLEGIAANQTSIGLKRSDNQNSYINGIRVLRPMKPMLTAITIDGRDGVIDEANKTVAVQIPYEANLAALTVVPTIVWNEAAATNSIVVNDGSAWIEGANTYKLTDKDGDYTVYTITLTRDVLKHTVSFNTHGGSAVASELVEDGGNLAAAPADPTKEDYIFQYWSEDEDGAEVDVTTVQINADKEFHAVWASDGAIKLLDGSTVNHTNFITAVTATETVEFMGNTVNYAKFSGTVSGVNGVKDLTRVIAYNATTNKTKIQISAHNNSTSARSILVKGLVEGAAEAVDLATIDLGNKEDKVSDWIEFNNAANRTIYIMVSSSAGDVYFTQVKVIESGETPMKQAGEAGYSLNLNKGRFFGTASTDLAFEGLSARLSGDYTALNSGYAKLNATSMSFTVASDMNLVVTTNNSKTYYVTKGAAGTDNETAKTGESEFALTAGTWFITAGAAEVQFTNLAFALPKCEKPTISAQPESKQTFGPGNLTATVVATVSDGGTLKYQWYNASNDEEVDGATSATLTTTTEGTYYVIVTNTLADHSDNFIKSAEATLGYRVTYDATLSALSASEGTLDPTFAKDVEEYRVDLPEGTVDVPTLSATATMDGYADVAINNATAFVNYEATSTVVVTSEDGTANKTYTVKFYVDHLLPQVDVTESTTWDWTYAAEGTVTIKVTDSTEPIKKNEEGLMANVRVDDNKPTNDATFNSQALLFYGENVRAKDGGRWYASLGHIKFNVTKPGIVEVEFSDNGSNNRCLSINGFMSPASSSKTDVKTFKVFVPAGEVTLMGMEGAAPDKYIRISKITYTVKESPDYTRNVTNNIGTLCVNHNVLVGGALGATFYQIASRNELYDFKIDFEEVLPGEELKAGEPYIFQSTTGRIDLFYGETEADAPVAVRGMIGSFVDAQVDITEENKSDILYIAQNKLWNCEDLVASDLDVVANRAYIVMSDVPTYTSAPQQNNPAPRRRVTLGRNSENTATGIDAINATDKPMKLIIDGNIFIIRGEKMYDVTGKLVK